MEDWRNETKGRMSLYYSNLRDILRYSKNITATTKDELFKYCIDTFEKRLLRLMSEICYQKSVLGDFSIKSLLYCAIMRGVVIKGFLSKLSHSVLHSQEI